MAILLFAVVARSTLTRSDRIGSLRIMQALVYPLTVAAKSTNKGRQQAANRLLQHMSEHSSLLVGQAKLVRSSEARMSVLKLGWNERVGKRRADQSGHSLA